MCVIQLPAKPKNGSSAWAPVIQVVHQDGVPSLDAGAIWNKQMEELPPLFYFSFFLCLFYLSNKSKKKKNFGKKYK